MPRLQCVHVRVQNGVIAASSSAKLKSSNSADLFSSSLMSLSSGKRNIGYSVARMVEGVQSGSESGAVKSQSGSELSETVMGESMLLPGCEKCGAHMPLAMRQDPTTSARAMAWIPTFLNIKGVSGIPVCRIVLPFWNRIKWAILEVWGVKTHVFSIFGSWNSLNWRFPAFWIHYNHHTTSLSLWITL